MLRVGSVVPGFRAIAIPGRLSGHDCRPLRTSPNLSLPLRGQPPMRRSLFTITYQNDITLIGDRSERTPKATGDIPCTHRMTTPLPVILVALP